MAKDIEIKTVEQAEIVINRMAKRLKNKVVELLMPVIPIYQYTKGIPSDGVLLRYMFSVPGTLTRVVLFVPGVKKEKPLSIQAELIRESPSQSQTVQGILVKETLQLEMEFQVQKYDRFYITTPMLAEEQNGIISFEVSAVFRPLLESSEKISVAMSALEGAEDEGI